jgi:genome maintenance exonuclease 1
MVLKWNKQFTYPKSVRELINEKRHYAIGDEKLPSVTTILSATQSQEKQDSLAKWKAKVGEIEAERVKNTAGARGTKMHSILEGYIEGENVLDLTETGGEAHRMANTIIDQGFKDLDEIWGSEATLAYPGLAKVASEPHISSKSLKPWSMIVLAILWASPGLYAGATDLVGIYQGRDSIIDFKQSNKPKKVEWIEDYKLQGAAYATAHDYMFKTNIEQIVILMCTPDCFFQRFIINGKEFREYKWKWLERVNKYYEQKS